METLSDQIEVESRVEANTNDEDSTMEDIEAVVETPGTVSLAPSDSQDASESSTRASTPTENRAEHVSTDFLKPSELNDVSDDVTMKDFGPGNVSPTGAADEHANIKVVSWPSSTVTDPSSLPWKAGKTEGDPLDYGSESQKLEELLRLNDPNSPDLYKP